MATVATAARPTSRRELELRSDMSDARDLLQQHSLLPDATEAVPMPPTAVDKLQPLDSAERPHPPPPPPLSAAASTATSATKQQQHEQLMLAMTAASSLSSDALKDRDMDDGDKALCCEGYLRKRYSTSVYMGSWRYCIVQGCRLRWYMTEELARQDSQLRGEVWVRAVEPWNGHGSVNTYPHAFAVRTVSNRVLLCSAKSHDEKDAWLACLQRGVQQRSISKRSPGIGINATNSTDALTAASTLDRSSHVHESRRIVPEDMVRNPSEVALTPPVVAPPSVVALETSDSECAQCAIRFGAVRARRVVCSSCARAFCSRHCTHSVTLTHLGLRTARRCCSVCAQRQDFLTYLAALNRFLHTVSATGATIDAAIRHPQLDAASPSAELLDRTLNKLRCAPMSLVKTIKILYQTRRKPLLFRAACERLPFYVEHCVDRVENVWYQLLHLFQCCDADGDSASVQLFDLRRFIRAICRRSPRIALQTIWHVQASAGDTNALHPHSLLSLLGFIYPSLSLSSGRDAALTTAAVGGSDSATTWKELLLAQCPDHQRRAILRALGAAYAQSEALIAREPATPITRWLNATTVSQFEASARELALSGIELCAFQSSIQYESLRVSGSGTSRSNDGDSAVPRPLPPPGATPLDALVFDQVHFVQTLAAISERLRFVQPVARRSESLARELTALNCALQHSALYPLCTASDELLRVVRIPPTEGKVFSTKMRAPTLIFLECVPVTATTLTRGSTNNNDNSDGDADGDDGDADTGGDDDANDDADDGDMHLQAFLSSSQRSRSTMLGELLDAPPSLAILGDGSSRDSLVSSSNESSTDAILGGTGYGSAAASGGSAAAQRRRGSHMSFDDDDDDDSESLGTALDASPRPTKSSSSTLGGIFSRQITFPGASSTAALPSSDAVRHSERTVASAPVTAVDTGANRSFSLVTTTSAATATAVAAHKRHSVENIVYDCDVYGERWIARQQRIQRESPFGHVRGWQLFSVIVKTNDDLRQEVFTMQLLEKFRAIFARELGSDTGASGTNPALWLRTYRIVATGASIGLLETINDACSLDHLKKHFAGGDLAAYFTAHFGACETPTFKAAQQNFIASMAAYSVVCYVLLVKDRHNGNILLSSAGHIIHIDFGFILGIAPGGRFSVEDAPFKLTVEMVAIMGGIDSDGFARFRALLCDGFMALQRYHSEIAALLQTTGQHSPFPCFEGAKLAKVIADLRDRLCVGMTRQQIARRVDTLIRKSYNVWGTRQYDAFQLRSNNIHP